MDGFRQNLLEWLKHGHLIYSAENRSEQALREFERVAHALFDFEEAGLIEIQSSQSENIAGKDYCSFIAVRRLTSAGKQQLESEANQ